jgi:hypothetical protein
VSREKGTVKLSHIINDSTALNLLALMSLAQGAPALVLFAFEMEEDSGIVNRQGLPC